jgi:hypothetical protein
MIKRASQLHVCDRSIDRVSNPPLGINPNLAGASSREKAPGTSLKTDAPCREPTLSDVSRRPLLSDPVPAVTTRYYTVLHGKRRADSIACTHISRLMVDAYPFPVLKFYLSIMKIVCPQRYR